MFSSCVSDIRSLFLDIVASKSPTKVSFLSSNITTEDSAPISLRGIEVFSNTIFFSAGEICRDVTSSRFLHEGMLLLENSESVH